MMYKLLLVIIYIPTLFLTWSLGGIAEFEGLKVFLELQNLKDNIQMRKRQRKLLNISRIMLLQVKSLLYKQSLWQGEKSMDKDVQLHNT
jgi:hypothetical protein